ncbi:muts domain V-domain-containing protein [Hypoxylon sp. NC1633]|nr:muts domain V-domain-containing protein [Hypoxylon sp. NC1633]
MNGPACRRLTSALASHCRGYIGRRSNYSLSRWRNVTSLASIANASAAGPRRQQVRGKKTKTSMRLEDLPQGPIKMDTPLPPEPEPDEGPAYPTVVLQARRNMQRFENCVLLTRVGGFYELYFEQAEEYGPLLNLKVAHKKTNAGPVPMAGFPFFQLDRFLKTLVMDLNSYVAIAEEFPNDPGDKVKSNGLMHDRRVTRVITPGTLIDENFIDPYANNYVMAIHVNHHNQETDSSTSDGLSDINSSSNADAGYLAEPQPGATPIGLAWIDVSTGQFYTQSTTVTSLGSILSRVGPREIVVDEVLESQRDHRVFSVLAEDKHLITFAPHSEHLPLPEWSPMLESEIPAQTAQSFTSDEVHAGSLLLQYVKDRLQGLSIKLQPPLRYENMSVMSIDKSTMRSLEIKQTIRDGTFKGSLLHAIRRTVTKGGARLLNAWLSAPSTSLETITSRQDLVEHFAQHPDLRDEIVLLLRRSHDSQRLVQKFALGRGDPDDLIALANTIRATQDIVSLLEASTPTEQKRPAAPSQDTHPPSQTEPTQSSGKSCFAPLLSRIKLADPGNLATRIKNSIDEEGLVQQHQNEDSEASHLMTLASDVVASEGTQGDDAASSSALVPLPKAAAAKRKRQAPASLRDYYYNAAVAANTSNDDGAAFVMRPEASPGLRALHAELAALVREKHVLAEDLRRRTGAASLTLRWTPNLGHVCHVKGAKDLRRIADAEAAAKSKAKSKAETEDEAAGNGDGEGIGLGAVVSSSRSTRAYQAPAWAALGRRLHQTRWEVGVEEQRLFADLRALVVANLVKLRRNAGVLDELDVTASFARLADENGWTRPVLRDTHAASTTAAAASPAGAGSDGDSDATATATAAAATATDTIDNNGNNDNNTTAIPNTATTTITTAQHLVLGGRHPTVELGLRERGRTFTQNDCQLSGTASAATSATGRLWLITGPNMAGKSTYLRQNAVILILAQAGCPVPASYAELSVADAVFSRVGSADDLSADRSTFMVEMLETAAILRAATPRSFVIMDEVGRGTTPEDGAAVAFAALHHLVTVNRCRALFATHFHGLADMVTDRGLHVSQGGAVEMYCTDVEEDEAGGFVYVHKLRKGVNRQSHALKVARLANLPEAAITVAKEVLEKLERDRHEDQTQNQGQGQVQGQETSLHDDTHTKRQSASAG